MFRCNQLLLLILYFRICVVVTSEETVLLFSVCVGVRVSVCVERKHNVASAVRPSLLCRDQAFPGQQEEA